DASPAPRQEWTVASDERTGTLILRGTETFLKKAAEIIVALDVPQAQPIGAIPDYRVVNLRNTDAEKVTGVLQALGIRARVVSVQSANAVLVSGSEEALKEIDEVIKALDVGQQTPGLKK